MKWDHVVRHDESFALEGNFVCARCEFSDNTWKWSVWVSESTDDITGVVGLAADAQRSALKAARKLLADEVADFGGTVTWEE